MGLDTSHDCWHGSYGAFHRWRCEIASAAGLPPLELMEGFYEPLDSHNLPTLYHGINTREKDENNLTRVDAQLPIAWDCLKPSPLHELLHHSDCDGEIPWESCGKIADSLAELLPKLPTGEAGGHIGNWRDKTSTFIDGLRKAHAAKENVDFH